MIKIGNLQVKEILSIQVVYNSNIKRHFPNLSGVSIPFRQWYTVEVNKMDIGKSFVTETEAIDWVNGELK